MLGFHSISAAPISARPSLATTASSDLSPYAGSNSSLAARQAQNAQQAAQSANSRVWINPDSTAVASSDLAPYAQSLSRRITRAVSGSSWVDLSAAAAAPDDRPVYAQSPIQRIANTARGRSWADLDGPVVASSDLAPYAQTLSRRITRATTGSAWVDLTAAAAAPADLPVYAQSVARFAQQRIKTAAWVDLDTTITVSSDLSPYAQSLAGRTLAGRNARVTTGGAWVDLTAVAASSDLSPYAQSSPKQRSPGAYSRYWVDIDPSAAVASSDLSPYAQTRVVESWWRTTRRSTGTGWNGGDDFFPPQDALSVYGQSSYPQSRVARPLRQGAAWVDLLDDIVPVTPPATGAGGRNYYIVSARSDDIEPPKKVVRPRRTLRIEPRNERLETLRRDVFALGKQIHLSQAEIGTRLALARYEQEMRYRAAEQAVQLIEQREQMHALIFEQILIEFRINIYNNNAARLLLILADER